MSISSDSGNAAGSTPPRPPAVQSATPLNRLKSSWSDPAKRPMLIFGFGAVGVAFILLIIALTQMFPASEPAAPVPTPLPTCVGPNCPQTPPKNRVPDKLHVRDRTFEIDPVAVPKGKWTAGSGEGQVEWVFGTVVNYLLGLPNTPENKDLLEALSEADTITLEMADGQTVGFKFEARQLVAPENKDVFAQQRPGLTLILLGDDGEQRLVVVSGYDVANEPNTAVTNNVVAINTPVEIGPARVKALNGRLVENAPGIPVGSAFYLVDFTVENVGEEALNASDFVLELMDFARQKYKLSDTASKLGPHPPPGGQLLPGLSGTFMSGFEVPSNITGPVLTWSFKPNSSYKTQANVAVPLIGPTPTPDPRSQARVQITQAYFTPDQSEMIIVGGISNPTGALIPVTPSAISLSTPEGILATLNSTEPALPWRLGPGDTLNFTLRFSRLPSGMAVLKILNNSFELTLQ
jgi:hypothetical protein